MQGKNIVNLEQVARAPRPYCGVVRVGYVQAFFAGMPPSGISFSPALTVKTVDFDKTAWHGKGLEVGNYPVRPI
jgi:hypothetical protein